MMQDTKTFSVWSSWVVCAAASMAATAALFLLIPIMNRSSDGVVEKPPQRRVAWVSPQSKPAAADPVRPKPPAPRHNPKPCPPRPPSPRQPSVRNAPPAARQAPPALPLRIDSTGFLSASTGGVTLYAPVGAPAASGAPAPKKEVKPAEKPFYLPHETDRLPAPVNRVLPEYPRLAWKDGVEGFAVVRFTVDRTGKVNDMVVEEWSGSRDFCAAATKALSQWSFTAGSLNGKPVAVVMRQRFVFSE